MRVAVEQALRLGDAHQFEHPERLGASRGLGAALVQRDRLGDLVADGEHRIERGHRLLEDHRHFVAAHATHRLGRELGEVAGDAVAEAEVERAARDRAAAQFDEAHQAERGHRLARARFAHHRDGLARIDPEGEVLHRGEHAVLAPEADGQVFDRDQGLGGGDEGNWGHLNGHGIRDHGVSV